MLWWCAALCSVVARQTGQETQFCSQLVVDSIMIGRLCKVLWSRIVQHRGGQRANGVQEGVSQGGRSGMQSTHAFASRRGWTHEKKKDWVGRLASWGAVDERLSGRLED